MKAFLHNFALTLKRNRKKIESGSFCLLLIAAYFAAYFGAQKIESKVEPKFRQASAQINQMPVIVLDAGHGGIDGGCSSADGVPEKEINLDIMLDLRDMLVISGFEVEVTRDSDRSIHDSGIEGIANQKASDMDNRLALFNKYDNAICLSIHQNQYVTPDAFGAQMFYSSTNPKSEYLAQTMQNSFVKYLQPDNTREIKLCGEELFLCRFCDNPTVMIECGFLSNPTEAELLKDESYRRSIAFTIFAGLCEYLAQS